MTDEELVLLETDALGIATVTLNRPAVHNAMNEIVMERLCDVMADLGNQDGVRAIFLQGAGKSFCAGADLEWMRRAVEFTEAQNLEDALGLATLLRTIHELPKPVIALIHGNCSAGGVGLAAACDIAVAVRDTQFSLSEVKLGLVPATISPYVVAAMGSRQAHRYFLTAERFDANEARRIGLVHEVVSNAAGLAEGKAHLAQTILAAAPGAVANAKALIGLVAHRDIDTDLGEETAALIAKARVSAEGREGVSAFLEKRKPRWVVPAGPHVR